MNKRNSNIECLRIISMLFIVLFHFLGRLTIVDRNSVCVDLLYYLFSSWGIVGVNVFVMISAWFLLDNKTFYTKRIVNTLLLPVEISLTYNLVFFLKNLSGGRIEQFFFAEAKRFFEPLWCKEYWFVTAYINMILVAPYINRLFEKKELAELKRIVLITLFIPFLLNFLVNNTDLNPLCDAAKFIWIYCAICFHKKFLSSNKGCSRRKKTKILLLNIVIFILGKYFVQSYNVNNKGINLLQEMVMRTFGNDHRYSFILVIIAFLIFDIILGFEPFTNRIINYIASATFGVYLIHENATITIASALARYLNYRMSDGISLFLAIVIGLALFIVCIVVSMIWNRFIHNCICKLFNEKMSSKYKKIDEYLNGA